MSNFSLCEAFFSGFYFFREEFASSALGYALSPFSANNVDALKFFIEQLLSTQNKYLNLLQQAYDKLNSTGNLTWANSFVQDPLSCQEDIASAIEYNEIDILLRIGDVIFLFENKIYDNSVGAIGKQIVSYKKSLPESYQDKIIPIAIFPKIAKDDYCDIIALSWNGKEEFTLRDLFAKISADYLSIRDFVKLIENDFSISSRTVITKEQSYDVLISKFEPGFPEIIKKLFPIENFSPGEDMYLGGCLLYRLPLNNSKEECFPFRLLINGKCEILYQGLRKKCFLAGKTFDGKHTIRDIIKLYLIKKGLTFTTRYHFSYKELKNVANQQAFLEVIELLKRIDAEEWNSQQFFDYFNKLNDIDISLDNFRDILNECLLLPDEKLLKSKENLGQIARIISLIKS